MSGRRLFIGGDPGARAGGIVCIDDQLRLIFASRLPRTQFQLKGINKSGKPKLRSRTNETLLADLIATYITKDDDVTCFVEMITPQGGPKAAAFQATFDSFGVLRGTFAMAGFALHVLPDEMWRDYTYGIIKARADKEKSIQLAVQRCPDLVKTIKALPEADQDGVAEAYHMARTIRDITLGVFRPPESKEKSSKPSKRRKRSTSTVK